MRELQKTTQGSVVMTGTLYSLYKMHLRFAYGDVERLINELKDVIEIYKQSPNAESEVSKKRISYYESIIEIAENDST